MRELFFHVLPRTGYERGEGGPRNIRVSWQVKEENRCMEDWLNNLIKHVRDVFPKGLELIHFEGIARYFQCDAK